MLIKKLWRLLVWSLECLGQTQEMFGASLTPVIINKLPAEIRRNFAREHDGDNITLQNLHWAINMEVKFLEAGQIENSNGLHTTATFLSSASKKHKKTRDSTHHVDTTEIKSRLCNYCCTENHFPGDCRKVANASSRFNILKQKKCVSTV